MRKRYTALALIALVSFGCITDKVIIIGMEYDNEPELFKTIVTKKNGSEIEGIIELLPPSRHILIHTSEGSFILPSTDVLAIDDQLIKPPARKNKPESASMTKRWEQTAEDFRLKWRMKHMPELTDDGDIKKTPFDPGLKRRWTSKRIRSASEILTYIQKLKDYISELDPNTKDPIERKALDDWNKDVLDRRKTSATLSSLKMYLEMDIRGKLYKDESVTLSNKTKTKLATEALRFVAQEDDWQNTYSKIFISDPYQLSEGVIKLLPEFNPPIAPASDFGMANSIKLSIIEVRAVPEKRVLVRFLVDRETQNSELELHEVIFKKKWFKQVLELYAVAARSQL